MWVFSLRKSLFLEGSKDFGFLRLEKLSNDKILFYFWEVFFKI